jgi:alanyl-tRNA synthetase
LGKEQLTSLFSSDPDRYYKVSLFDELGFKRYRCNICSKFFWSLSEKLVCPDHEYYDFIGNPPTNKRLDYISAWREVEKYFRTNAHAILRRYPVVCRWRDDLFFTIASIVDFQRVIGDKVVFELPENPLVIPQMCLRFNDIENVGLSGRHYTSFCMIGQVSNADAPGGYWKDRCIELDFGMLTNGLGIKRDEITFVEDVWMGAGAFGYSLEYFVRGLELGNAVFTEYEGNENDYRTMPNRIIDMGAGLERFSWITMGTPTSYECSFGPVVGKLVAASGTAENSEILSKYFSAVSTRLENIGGDIQALKSIIAKELHVSRDLLVKMTTPYEAIYTIADHTRTLLFAISDGSIPSNVGGGYNLRVILRRVLSILERWNWKLRIEDIADMHVDYLKRMYPELEEHREDVKTILQIESNRYMGSRERMESIAESIRNTGKCLTVDELIRLYESDGVTPDFLVDVGALNSIPSAFYTRLSELHTNQITAQAQKPTYDLDGLPPTRLLYYEDSSTRVFTAKVLKVINDKLVVLDQTAFYPRGGGQEPDTGELDGGKVVEVVKHADIVIHMLYDASTMEEGKTVLGKVNDRRRELVSKHHTATHVLNSSARVNLGSWVWQNSAYKEENYARLDITHHSSLTREEMERIEKTANSVIGQNLPIKVKIYDRIDAERTFSFRIYQGGAAPTANIRIVNIENWDTEACGGTHMTMTGQIGLIKIIKSERIQDGIVRIEFVAGEAALKYVQNQENHLATIAQFLGSSKEKVVKSFLRSMDEAESVKKRAKILLRKVTPSVARSISEEARPLCSAGIKLYHVYDDELDEEYHISVGEKSVEMNPYLIYVALISKGDGMRVVVFVGEKARDKIKAGSVAKLVSVQLGGSGGGDDKFGQGGGKSRDKTKLALLSLEELIRKSCI